MHQTYCCKTHTQRHIVALMIYGTWAVKINRFQGHLIQCQCTHLIPLSILSSFLLPLESLFPAIHLFNTRHLPYFFHFQFCLPVSFFILLSSPISLNACPFFNTCFAASHKLCLSLHPSVRALYLLALLILLLKPLVVRSILVLSIVCC